MSKVSIQGDVNGTADFTIKAPDSNVDRTLTLPDEAGSVLTDVSDIETQVKTATNATGTAPIYACRAWVNFNGTFTESRDSGNVSSITDLGVGDYQVNFSTDMPSRQFAVTSAKAADDDPPSASNTVRDSHVYEYEVGYFKIGTASASGNQFDPQFVCCAVFR